MRAIIRFDDNISLSIDRFAFADETSKRGAAVGILEQGPIIFTLNPFEQEIDIRAQPDRYRGFVDSGPGFGIHECSATGRQYMGRFAQKARNDLAFTGAKCRFAKSLEYVVDTAPGSGFDLRVGVSEWHAKRARQTPPDRRLASAHHTDQDDGFVELSHGIRLHLRPFARQRARSFRQFAILIPIPPQKEAMFAGAGVRESRWVGKYFWVSLSYWCSWQAGWPGTALPRDHVRTRSNRSFPTANCQSEMTPGLLKAKRSIVMAGIAAVGLAISGTAIWAQDADSVPPNAAGMNENAQPMADTRAPEATGTPRNIIHMEELAPPEKAGDTPPLTPAEDSAANPLGVHTGELPPPDKAAEMPSDMPPKGPILRSGGTGAVQVGELGTLEGPLAGTLDASSGGLGSNEWQGSDRPTMVTMLQSVPAATPSATERLLIRKLLLTAAAPPPGHAMGSFNQLRLTRLLDGGYIDDAAKLALRMQEPNNFDLLRVQTDALLYDGRDNDACSDLTSHRLDSAEPFWVELRAYCYAVTNDAAPLDLTRAVITEQGIADPAFIALLDGWTSGKPKMPDTIRFPDSIHIAMLAHLKLPMTNEIATGTGLPGSLIAASSVESPPQIRIGAAERALRAGMLPVTVLQQVLDLTSFSAQDLNGASALARTEPFMKALARLSAAIKSEHEAAGRAELIHTAFEIGEREGLLRQVAELLADPAAQIMPAPDWSGWSDLMARGLLLAGHPESAQRWLDILDPAAPQNAAEVQQLELAFALSAPNPRRNADAKQVLANITQLAQPPAKDPAQPPDSTDSTGTAMDQPADPAPEKTAEKLTPQSIARTVLDLGVFDAAQGQLMPSDMKVDIEPLMKQISGGRRPADVLMQRIDKAALADSRGEVALAVATALGDHGPGDLSPDIVVRLIRALQTASMRDAAHLLAQEAFLLRPSGATPQ